MSTASRTLTVLSIALVAALLLAACGQSEAAEDGVASLDDGADSTSEEEASEPAASDEEQMLEYIECLRDQGIDVPDPEVDAEGNLQFRVQAGGGGGQQGEGGQQIDPEQFQEARDVCGDPPNVTGGPGSGDPEAQAEFQDAALQFAQCMRDHGIDMPDPDFSGEGGVQFRQEGPLNSDDPEVQAAADECQQEAFGDLPGGPQIGVGGGGAGENGS